jgi:uncharacterized protein GlcG (DUF336 family)
MVADAQNEGARPRATLPGIIGSIPIMASKEVLGAVGFSPPRGKNDDCSQAGINGIREQNSGNA